jgi:hypothetical protein
LWHQTSFLLLITNALHGVHIMNLMVAMGQNSNQHRLLYAFYLYLHIWHPVVYVTVM